MNYSDYDSDGYSSNEDKDYVPSEDNLSEDDMNECVKEDGLEGDEDQAQQPVNATRKKKKTKGADLGMRKRKKGGLRLEEDKEKDGETEEKREEPLEEETGLLAGRTDPAVKEEVQKKKADDLWASFLSDVGSKPKPPTPSTRPQAEPSSETQSPSAVASSTPRPSALSPSQPARVTITKVFDFAGEEVRVTKEVSSQSKEAKSYLKEQEEKAEERSPAACKPLGPGPSAKRPAGMGSILNRLGGKKAKMSTLEKSKMDWDTFKSEEGITEELAIHNRGKEGYVERKNFLERVDHRQFELEKKVRLNNMKR